MKILIEEHQYEAAEIKDVLYGIDPLENIEGKVSVHYVGYYYNTRLQDCVFMLPKVVLDENELIFGKYDPKTIMNLGDNDSPLTLKEKDFLYTLAVWIYRAIIVYEQNPKPKNSDVIYHSQIAQVGIGGKRLSNTYLDIILSLLQFQKENRNFFLFILKNLHSGYNKINWTRTIATQPAIVQDNTPIYLNPVNKRRQVNFDEELIIIFYSILNYINETYGFPVTLDCNFQLIKGERFKAYVEKGLGRVRLRQIKYKYFSDKALELWNLCFAFFDQAKQVYINKDKREYLLAKDFYIVFEAIIDELISDSPLPDDMKKEQEDGKIVDHLFTAQSLIGGRDANGKDAAGQTYYIGDSKYYKMGHPLGKESIYKQYTYARNVIQWNLDIWNSGKPPKSNIKLRDDVTEGYNIIPNFFISAKIEKDGAFVFDYSDDCLENREKGYKSIHFPNRLFDRDTLLLSHYDVNFLFVLSLYARNKASQKAEWKEKVRKMFREEIQKWLKEEYDFYALKAHSDIDSESYFRQHFKQVIGKVFSPYADKTNADKPIYSLALEKPKSESDKKEYEDLKTSLEQCFDVVECPLGENPIKKLERINTTRFPSPQTEQFNKDGVLMVMMEDYEKKSKSFLEKSQIAIRLNYTKDSMEIAERLNNIGYIFFHTRNAGNNKHLFMVQGKCTIKSNEEMTSEEQAIYKNIKATEATNQDPALYIIVNFQPTELDSSALNPSKAPHNKGGDLKRYDAQYVTKESLV